jgi:ribosomal 30S subunit maturation factor RimM
MSGETPGRIAVGVIRKAHGVRGEASIEPWTDSPERFEDLSAVTLVSPGDAETRAVTIESTTSSASRSSIRKDASAAPWRTSSKAAAACCSS